jgi:hypothetical protein
LRDGARSKLSLDTKSESQALADGWRKRTEFNLLITNLSSTSSPTKSLAGSPESITEFTGLPASTTPEIVTDPVPEENKKDLEGEVQGIQDAKEGGASLGIYLGRGSQG